MKKCGKAALAAAGAYLFAISPRLLGRPDRMPGIFYAHRGLHDNASEAPENTMAAFSRAVEAGYGIELDVQLTRDGQVVVAHDFDLRRICRENLSIDSLTYEELCQYTIFYSQEHIPLFSEVLDLVQGKVPLIVELKYKSGSQICEKAQEILDSYSGAYCIESFHPQVLIWYKKYRPAICRGQLSMNFQRDDGSSGEPERYLMRHLLTNFLTRPDFIAYDCRAKRALSRNLCRILYRCPSVAWTVRSRSELEGCRKYYDYFIFEGFCPEKEVK